MASRYRDFRITVGVTCIAMLFAICLHFGYPALGQSGGSASVCANVDDHGQCLDYSATNLTGVQGGVLAAPTATPSSP